MYGGFDESELANYGQHAIRVWGGHVWVGGAEPTVWEWWAEAQLNCPARHTSREPGVLLAWWEWLSPSLSCN